MAACGAVAGVAIGALALLVSFDVAARNLGVGTFPWIVEASEYGLALVTFLAAPWLLHRAEHVRIDILLTALPPRQARRLGRAVDALGLAVCAVLCVTGARVALDSARLGSLVIKSMVFPEWWLFLPVPASFALLSVEFARRVALAPQPRPLEPPR
jgi:TRAP-type C4-dicarboxylate transport system permease small subunit